MIENSLVTMHWSSLYAICLISGVLGATSCYIGQKVGAKLKKEKQARESKKA